MIEKLLSSRTRQKRETRVAKSEEHVNGKKNSNLVLGKLLASGTIPLESINPDGSFNVARLKSEDYFQKNPHIVDTLDLHTRQLSEKSRVRQKVIFLDALHKASCVEPSVITDESSPRLSEKKVNTIVDTAHVLGEEYVEKLLTLTDTQEVVFTKAVIDSYDQKKSKLIFSNEAALSQDKPLISRKWQAASVVGNALIGTAEVLTGGGTTLSVVADGIHNAGDAGMYYVQTENVLNPKLSEEKIYKRRKVAHTIIAGLSLGVVAKAGIDLSFDHEMTQNPLTIYAAGASLALNSYLTSSLYRGVNRKRREGTLQSQEKDIIKHLLAVDIPSAGLAVGGAIAQRYGYNTLEPMAAIVSGIIGAYEFRPTTKNLADSDEVTHTKAPTPKRLKKFVENRRNNNKSI